MFTNVDLMRQTVHDYMQQCMTEAANSRLARLAQLARRNRTTAKPSPRELTVTHHHWTGAGLPPAGRPVHRLAFYAVAAASLVVGAIVPLPAAAAGTLPFSISIRHISCVDPCDEEGLEDTLEETPDFYVKVWIDGVKQPPGSSDDDPSSSVIEDDDSIDPSWTISTMIPENVVNVPVTIQVWDDDSTSGDDLADVSGHDADNNLDFRVDRQTGRWIDWTADGSGDKISWPQNCSTGDGGGGDDEPRAKVCFDIGGDTDGDGLLDSWERDGYDDNGDGFVDVDLPVMGADPERKDLFLELDYANNLGNRRLRRTDIVAMKAAFAAAPHDAGWRAGDRDGDGDGDSEDTFGRSARPDPFGRRGINLHVDTGAWSTRVGVRGRRWARASTASTTMATASGTTPTRSAPGSPGPSSRTWTPQSRTRSRATARTTSTTTVTS
jgi:hypothetical protein